MAYDNSNTGTLGKNKRKEKDTQPGYKGKCNVGGKDYWISAWVRKGSDGESFFSLSFEAKEAQVSETRRQHAELPRGDDIDVPF
jgi:hypothetical protein